MHIALQAQVGCRSSIVLSCSFALLLSYLSDTNELIQRLMLALIYGPPRCLIGLCSAVMVGYSTKAANDKKQHTKSRPNHFLAVKVTDNETRSNFVQLQRRFVDANPTLKKAAVPANKLHVTLFVCTLNGETEVALAKQTLESIKFCCSAADADPDESGMGGGGSSADQLQFRGICSFNRRVLFVPLVENAALLRLRRIRDSLLTAFVEAGLNAQLEEAAGSAWKPHLTLAKVSRLPQPQRRRCRLSEDGLKIDDAALGCQALESVQLCSMAEADASTGYYRVLGVRTL